MAKFTDLPLLEVVHTIQIAGALWAGNGKSYLCLFPDERNDQPVEVLEMTPEEWQTFLRQTDLLETEVLTKAADGTLAKAVIRESTSQIDQGVSWRVFKRDGYRCRYCGADDVPLTVDHLVRWEEGGPSTEANLLSADRTCNRRRGNLSYAQWLDHPYYKKVSKTLTEKQREANRKLAETLDRIPRVYHIRSR